jgi:hypothetical protein
MWVWMRGSEEEDFSVAGWQRMSVFFTVYMLYVWDGACMARFGRFGACVAFVSGVKTW